MGEGVDPKQMCQSLMDKVSRSEQLLTLAEPELLVLFEDWLEELEAEVLEVWNAEGPMDEGVLAETLGLSRSGAVFIFSKLKREGKLDH
jgi:hypothetical protein